MVARSLWRLRVRTRLRGIVWGWKARRYGALGRGARIGRGTRISNHRNVFLGANAVLYEDCHILSDAGTFVMGANSHLAAGVYVNAVRGEVRLGDGVSVGPRSVLLAYTNHYEAGRSSHEVRRVGRVLVEDDVFLGAHVVVLPDVRIGTGAVVGAGAVVTRDVPPHVVVAGVPARVIRRLQATERPTTAVSVDDRSSQVSGRNAQPERRVSRCRRAPS
jgi:galactoside O-acetyltransferase